MEKDLLTLTPGAPQAPDRESCHSEAQIFLLLCRDGDQE